MDRRTSAAEQHASGDDPLRRPTAVKPASSDAPVAPPGEGAPADGDPTDHLQQAELLAPMLIHEMRQPLTGIRACLELIARRFGPQVSDVEEWTIIVHQTDRLEELFRAYQEFLHPERGVPRPFAVQDVLNKAVKLLKHRLRKLGDRFVFEPPPPLPEALGVPSALLHAVTNVLVNALDALDSLEPGATPRLQVRLLPADNNNDSRVHVRISDEGPGIAPQARERIFETRFTTKTTGSGLGLAIARRMVTSFGGAIDVVPDTDPLRLPWAKTEFLIEVPVVRRLG